MSAAFDLLAALEQLRLLAHAFREHALTAQIGFDRGFGHREHLSFDALAFLVRAFPHEGELLAGCYLGHGLGPCSMTMQVSAVTRPCTD